MNTSILRNLLPLSLLATLGPAGLMAQAPTHFTIPFDFTVGKQQFLAGGYQVGRTAPSVLIIRAANGDCVLMTLANTTSSSTIPGKDVLTFDKIGNRYFLSKLSAENYGLELIQPKVEKELLAKRASRKPIAVVASTLK
jgi:hypothetical protein